MVIKDGDLGGCGYSCGGGSACGDLGRWFRVGVAICVVTNQLMVVPDSNLGWVWLFVW